MNLESQLMVIKRGTTDILTEEELVRKLKEKRPLNIKFGVDPTSPDIHLGHTVPLIKLRQFQDLGHKIQLVIGDYTAVIGDPTGRKETRPVLTRDEINKNAETYSEQLFKILDIDKTELLYNGAWLGKFSGTDIMQLGSKYTLQQLLQRRDFRERIEQNKPLSITELLYPLLVGYDSVHLKSDIEIGGTDQLFNFMASREMQKAHGQKPEVIITFPLLKGLDGIKKMSKSLGNAIGINDEPFDMYGKLMSISDKLMIEYYELISDISADNLANIRKEINDGRNNPMIYKQELAREVVQRFHGTKAAELAEKKFSLIHKEGGLPQDIEKIQIIYATNKDLAIRDILKKIGRAESNSQARRLVIQKGVKIDGKVISDSNYCVTPSDGVVIQVGKLFFRKLYFRNTV